MVKVVFRGFAGNLAGCRLPPLQRMFLTLIEQRGFPQLSTFERGTSKAPVPTGRRIQNANRSFPRCSHNGASLREGSVTEGDDRSLRRRGFDDRFGTFYTSLILAGSLSLASARQLPPGRSLYTHNRVGTKQDSTAFFVRLRVVETSTPTDQRLQNVNEGVFREICVWVVFKIPSR